ncbi:regulator of G protein [Tritrichomonas foetus]|uniref:Regulator of G protein n=1 Tax=Tritrichomonas foetus TaxID=1144522 RepID=A0A1J4KK06_9EUKA|nr:regulator of G protein [Tritrichomonas foetus]|eukprot:OHT11450.1 regulator of G protein [Tritrichomonas foetus]
MVKVDISDTQWDFLPPNSKVIDVQEIGPFAYFIFYLWAVWSFVWLAGSILFIIRLSTGDTNIRMRSPTLVLLSAFGAEMAFSCTAWDIAVTRSRFPCCLDLYYILLFLPLYFVPFVLRFAKYIFTMIQLEKWQKGLIKDVHNHPFVKESTYVTILGFVITILLLIANLFQWQLLPDWVNAYGCQLRDYTFIILVILVSICFLLFVVGFFIMAKIPDPYKIKSELISCSIVWICCLVPYLVFYKLNKYSNILVTLMFIFIVAGYFTSVLWPIYLSFKHPPEEESNDNILVTFDQMVLDPDAYKIIEQIAAIKVFAEVPPFCRAVLKYRRLENPEQLKAKAQQIFDMFIKPGSPQQNNFPASMVRDIEERLQFPTNDLFNRVYQEATKLFVTGNFLREVRNKPEFIELVNRKKEEMLHKNDAADILASK